MIGTFRAVWRRRHWRADPAALAPFADQKPITVITGGSEGIGLAIAKVFLRHGDHVLLVARDADKLARAVAALDAPPRVDVLALDLTQPDSLARLDQKLAELSGYCDVLVNAAGMGHTGLFAAARTAEIDHLLALNVAALTRLTHHMLPGMLVRGRGGVLNVASLGGYVPGPYQAAYYASKAYVLSLSEAIAFETAGRGVHVAVLAPGPVRTAFHAKMGGTHSAYRLFPAAHPAWVAWTGVVGFKAGARLIVPGPITAAAMLAVRTLPHRLSLPIVGFLLKPRRFLQR